MREAHTHDLRTTSGPCGSVALWLTVTILVAAGCRTTGSPETGVISETGVPDTYTPRYLTLERCCDLSRPLMVAHVEPVPEAHLLRLHGTPAQLQRAQVFLDLVDNLADYCVENLGPASAVRTLPSNPQIAQALGNLQIGTFDEPPARDAEARAIIDLQGDSIFAILPARYRGSLRRLLAQGNLPLGPNPVLSSPTEPNQLESARQEPLASMPSRSGTAEAEVRSNRVMLAALGDHEPPREGSMPPAPAVPTGGRVVSSGAENTGQAAQALTTETRDGSKLPKTVKIAFTPAPRGDAKAEPPVATQRAIPDNGAEVLDMTLPETMTVMNLLDLAGKYLGLNCVYDLRDINNQSVSLKLEGDLQGAVTVKQLYALLETVLHSKGLAMIRQEHDFVTVVPLEKALQTQPELMDADHPAVQIGDTLVIRPFPIRYVDPVSVKTLLDTMKLTVAATPLDESNLLLVTCHADRLSRIEQLLEMIDRPGKARECRLRRLSHVAVTPLLAKVRAVVQQIQTAETVTVSAPPRPLPSPATFPARPSYAAPKGAVCLDADERTNRILMIGSADELGQIEELVDALDIPLEDTRTIVAYEIRHIDAEAAQKILADLDLVTAQTLAASPITDANPPALRQLNSVPATTATERPMPRASVVISRSTNALLVTATPEEHARLTRIIDYIDTQTPEDEETYQMYPLESSSPAHLATLLERLLVETTQDKDGKIEKIPKTQERIAIVPDPNTFSLVVYASQKNQRRIADLIRKLDRRRPQVLIDVTLVEVTRTDTFEYDLSLVARAEGAVAGNLVVNPLLAGDSGRRFEAGFNLPDADGNPTGRVRAFYSDENVQALLTAMQRKNYGRVLAKPKVLVDDGHEGQITTRDTTTYVKESIQIPQTGTPITTRDFVPIEASIKLQITPHISEGNLLRLDVFMSRDDFGTRPLSVAPPDKATSEVTTTVFVPDDRTVILGGLVKLNQSKGGTKVPILGDIPVVGLLFRSINNNNVEKKLYVFLKANIVRPYDGAGLSDLENISQDHEGAFQESEAQFQKFQAIPGITPKPVPPRSVLNGYK